MMSKSNLIDLVLISVLSVILYWGYTMMEGPIVDDLGMPDVKMHLQMNPDPAPVYFKAWDFKHCTPTNTDCGRLDEKSN